MTKDTIRWIISYALSKWQAATNINFREVTTGSADILIKFAPGAHGDPYPFDGRGGTLAHAYYPYRNYGTYFMYLYLSFQCKRLFHSVASLL